MVQARVSGLLSTREDNGRATQFDGKDDRAVASSRRSLEIGFRLQKANTIKRVYIDQCRLIFADFRLSALATVCRDSLQNLSVALALALRLACLAVYNRLRVSRRGYFRFHMKNQWSQKFFESCF